MNYNKFNSIFMGFINLTSTGQKIELYFISNLGNYTKRVSIVTNGKKYL